ncbi:MAG: hypothetical protein IT195_13850 [Microthrixaceae bacterium]|nr:hypothetical protein [Microthrixaceae bacterium]
MSERMRIGALAFALLCAGLAFAYSTAVGAIDLRTCLRAAMRQGRIPRWRDDRNHALPLLAAVAVLATAAVAWRCRLWAMEDAGIAGIVHKTTCTALVGLTVFGQGALIHWGRLVSEQSGRALVAGLLIFAQVTAALAGNLLTSLQVPGGPLLTMLCPPVFFFSKGPALIEDATFQVVRAVGFVTPQVLGIVLGVVLHYRARKGLAEQARNTLVRTGMMPQRG